MRTVIVNIQIQMDINSIGDEVDQVLNVVDQVNELIRSLDQQPQIFSGIDRSDIQDMEC